MAAGQPQVRVKLEYAWLKVCDAPPMPSVLMPDGD